MFASLEGTDVLYEASLRWAIVGSRFGFVAFGFLGTLSPYYGAF